MNSVSFTLSPRVLVEQTTYTATGTTALSINPTTGYVDVGTPSSYLPAISAPWVLHPFSDKARIADGRSYRADYQFDNQGSLTCLRIRKDPEASLATAATQVEYHNPIGQGPWTVTRRLDGSTVLQELENRYDGFGRLVTEKVRRPVTAGSLKTSERRRKYDVLGRLWQQTTWQDAGSFSQTKTTVFSQFDAFGRPGRAVSPDGQVELRTYAGIRLGTSQVNVRTSVGGTTPVITGYVVESRSNRLLRDSLNSSVVSNLIYGSDGNLLRAGQRSDGQPLFVMAYDAFNMQAF